MNNIKFNKSYTLIHEHSDASLSDGVMSCKQLVERAKEVGAMGVSLTDHGNMSNFLKFYNECQKNNINPIIGIELYINDSRNVEDQIDEAEGLNPDDKKNSHLILMAKNWNGVKSLFKISGEAFDSGYYYKPRSTNDKVIEWGEDIIVTTACIASQFSRYILGGKPNECENLMRRYQERFGKDFYGEVQINSMPQQKIVNSEILRLCDKLGIKVVFALDAHYANPEDWKLQQIKMLLLQKKTFADLNNTNNKKKPWILECDDLYIKSSQEIFDTVRKYNYDITQGQLEEWLENTNEINNKVKIEVPKEEQHFPKFNLPEEMDTYTYFVQLCKDGFRKLYSEGKLDPDIPLTVYADQLKKEIDILHKLKYVDYILVIKQTVDEIIKLGGRLGNGRGSCCGSFVVYCLGITKVDPIKWGLTFERWANLERKDAPDIDIDIDSDAKQLIEERLEQLYGKTSIAHIPNFVKFTPKTIIKDLCRVFGYDYTKSNFLNKELDKHAFESDEDDETLMSLEKLWEYIRSNIKNDDLLEFMDEIEEEILAWGPKLMGQVKVLSQHASGIVIADGNVSKHIPMQYVKGVRAGLQDGGADREISKMGLLKLDLLGLTNVSVIQDTVALIKQTRNIDADIEFYNNMDFDDKNIFERFQVGDTSDIFQFGSDGMRALLKDSKPNSLVDLTACNALFRPAPLHANIHNEYIESRKNPDSVVYLNDKLKKVLQETSGQIIFQEQLIQIVKELGNFTLGEADSVRKDLKMLSGDRAQEKSRKEENFKKFQKKLDKFKKGAMSNGLTENQTKDLINIMVKYAEYSFAKNHAFPYALNAYHSMWFKVYYPIEYYCSLINREDIDKIAMLITEAKKHGINVLYPSLKHLSEKFCVVDNNLQAGIGFAKGTSADQIAIMRALIDKTFSETDHANYTEIVARLLYGTIENKVSKKTIEPIILLGLFSEIDEKCFNTKLIYDTYDAIKHLTKKKLNYDNALTIVNEYFNKEDYQDYSTIEKTEFEIQYLSFFWKYDPIAKYERRLGADYVFTPSKCLSIIAKANRMTGAISGLYGLVKNVKVKQTKNGNDYYYLVVTDMKENVKVRVFNGYGSDSIEEGKLYIFKGLSYNSNWGFSVSGREAQVNLIN